ncbi:MAG: DUF5606 domain-containing protein [Bacteroidales bacterium]|nr:DUF5606 domain-containing protein [Bacteroidales bacterium]
MDLKDILAISGHSGLFKYVSDGRNGIIVEAFDTKKRMFVNASTKVSSLKDIAIYTETEEKPLADVLKSIFEIENGGAAIDPKSGNEELKAYMSKVLPEYDRERVYVSDIRKLVTWYSILRDNNLLNFEEEEKAEDAENKDNTEETPHKEAKKDAVAKTPKKPGGKPAGAGKKPATAKKTTSKGTRTAAK